MGQFVYILAHKNTIQIDSFSRCHLLVHPLHRASETDASQPGIEPGTFCTAGEHSMQTAICTGSLTAIRNLSLYYYNTCYVLVEEGPDLDSIPPCWPPM